MQRWTSRPLTLPIRYDRLKRAHLEFQHTRVGGPTFTVYTFLGVDEPLPDDAGRDHPCFAAAFTVFAHGACWGGEGHCDWKAPKVSPFDRRPDHHLQPVTYTLDVTDAVVKLGAAADRGIEVTVHAAHLSDRAATDVLRFERLALYAYER